MVGEHQAMAVGTHDHPQVLTDPPAPARQVGRMISWTWPHSDHVADRPLSHCTT